MQKLGPAAGPAPAVSLMEAILPRLRKDGWKCLSVGSDSAGGQQGAKHPANSRLLLTRVSKAQPPPLQSQPQPAAL